MRKWLDDLASVKSFGALALCFVMAWMIMGTACMPMNAYAGAEDDDVDTGATLLKISEIAPFAEITFNPPLPENGGYLDPLQEYVIHFDVDEARAKGYEMPDGSKVDLLFSPDSMYYPLPEGLDYTLTIPANGKLSFYAKDYQKNEQFEVRADVEVVRQEDGTDVLTVTWDKDAPGWYLLLIATNAQYNLEVQAAINDSKDVIELGDGNKYYVDNTAEAAFTKTFIPEVLPSLLTEEQKQQYTFALKDVYVAATEADESKGQTKDSEGYVRDARGNIVYDGPKDVTADFSMMTWDDQKKHYVYNFPVRLKPTGESIVVEETARPEMVAGYTWDAATSETKATSAEKLTGGSHRIVSLVNAYTEDQAKLKISKSLGANSDITTLTSTQKGNISFTIEGTKANGQAYGPVTYTYKQLEDMGWELDISTGTYKVTETSDVANYDWTVTYEAGIEGSTSKINGSTAETGDVTVGAGQTAVFDFTNSYDQHVGNIQLSKAFEGITPTAAQKAATSFQIKKGDSVIKWSKNGSTYTYDPDGTIDTITYDEFMRGSVGLMGLPVGNYTVTETAVDVTGYERTSTVSVNGETAAVNTSGSVDVDKNSNATISFNNKYEENASITVSKVVSGLTLNDVASSLTFTLQRKEGNEWTNVETDVSLGNDGRITWTGLPFATYRVVETAAAKPNYEIETSIAVEPAAGAAVNANNKNAEFTVSAAQNSVTTTFTNEYTPKTTELTINKNLVGAPEGAEDQIKFTVKKGNADTRWTRVSDAEYRYDENGTVTQIPYAASIELTNLPAGYTYTVTETTGTINGYVISTTANDAAGNSAGVTLTETNGVVNTGEVDFVNTYRAFARISINKSFTGVLSNAYVNAEILPKLRFVISTVENEETLYYAQGGVWSANKGAAYQFAYTELSTGLELDANKTYYIEELNADVPGFTVTTWWSQDQGGQVSQVTQGNLPSITVTPGQTPTVNFVNDYRDDGVGPVGNVQLHTKTWSGLEAEEQDKVMGEVRFKLEYKSGTTWKTYDTYTLTELAEGQKTYNNPDGTTVTLPISLPDGEYRLTEMNCEVSGYDHDVFITLVEGGDLDHATTVLMEDHQAVFTVENNSQFQFGLANVYTPKGRLQVRKLIEGVDDEDRTKNFSFTLKRKLGENGEAETVASFTWADFTNGVYTSDLLPTGEFQQDENGSWTLVPYIYTVEETDHEVGYHTYVSTTVKVDNGQAVTGTTAQVQLSKGSEASVVVEFTNTYTRSKGQLTIRKDIEGEIPEDEKNAITFQLYSWGGTLIKWNDVNGEHVFADGNTGSESSFTFADMTKGEDGKTGTFTIKNLNTGAYKVVESNADIPGYKRTTAFSVTGDGDTSGRITISETANAEVKVTNIYSPVASLKFVKKVVADGNGFADIHALAGFRSTEFVLYKGEGTSTWAGYFNLWGNTEVKQVSATEWHFTNTFSEMTPGIYTIVENVGTGTGYEYAETTVTGAERIADIDGKPAFRVNLISNDGNVIEIHMTNRYEEQGKVTVSKTVSGISGTLTDEQKESIVFGLYDADDKLIPAREGDAIASGDYAGWVSYARMSNGAYTWDNLDVSKQYYIKETVIGESNDNTAKESPFYGYIHTQTSWSVNNGDNVSTTAVPGVVETGEFSVNKDGVQVAFTNTYEQVAKLAVDKICQNYSSDLVGFDHLPVWRFTITVDNVGAASMQDNQTTITDVFDAKNKEWFKLVDVQGYQPHITSGECVELSATDHGDGTATYVLKLQEGAPENQQVIIAYYLQPRDLATFQTMLNDTAHKSTAGADGATWTYTNTITFHPLPGEQETDSADFFYNTDMVTKRIDTADGNMVVTFTLNINPDALYIGTHDRLVVLDKMSDNVEVNMSSFKVVPEEQTPYVDVSMYDGDEWDIQIEVPNGVALTITYSATIKDPTGHVQVSNKVSMEGVIEEVEGDVEFEGGSGGSMSVGAISVFKHGDTMAMPLQGAKFDLYQCENSLLETITPVRVAQFTSNENGLVVIQSWKDENDVAVALQWNVLYYLVETSAPEGYMLNDPNDFVYFRIYEKEAAKLPELEHYYKTGHVFLQGNASLSTQAQLVASKSLRGADLKEKQFTFQLLDEENHVLQTKQNAADGTITFEPIPYTYERFTDAEKAAGMQVHTYTIREVQDKISGITCDASEYAATVTVKLNADKTAMEASVACSKDDQPVDAAAFTNVYKAEGSVQPAGTKTLLNAARLAAGFGFAISDGETVIATVQTPVTDSGNTAAIPYPVFKYAVDPEAAAGVTYADGVITTRAKSAADIAGTYTYTITETAAGNDSFIEIDSAIYTYTVTVADDGSGKLTAAGSLSKKASAESEEVSVMTADFTNTLCGSLKVTKIVTVGGERTTGTLADGVYTVALFTDEACTMIARTVDGSQCTGELTIVNGNADDCTFTGLIPGTYWVKEIGDLPEGMLIVGENPVEITVDPTSYDVPGVTFTNNFALGDLSLTKIVTGTEAADKEFVFAVYVAETAGRTCTATKGDETLSVTFDAENTAMVRLKAGETMIIRGLPSGRAYRVEEKALPAGYDAGEPINGTGVIRAGALVEVTQNNTYQASGEAVLEVTKALTGNVCNGSEVFSFQLKDAAGNVIDTKSCVAGAAATFETQYYTQAGTYTYTIEEAAPETRTPGMTYNTTVYNVEVVVTDNGDGTLAAAVHYGGEDTLTVTNKYSAISFQPEVTKVLEGNYEGDKTFTFQLKDAAGTVIGTRTCKAGETVSFDAITKHEAGTYEYAIVEVAGDVPGMTYDTAAHPYTAVVTEDAMTGALSVAQSYGGKESLTITNTYAKPVGSAVINVTKAISGDPYNGDAVFEFTLTPAQEQRAENNAVTGALQQRIAENGIAAWVIAYDTIGRYSYTIKETMGTEEGFVYDDTVYNVTVDVAYASDGMSLETTVTYVNGAEDANGLVVTNKYGETQYQPQVIKELIDPAGDAPAESFSFTLTQIQPAAEGDAFTASASCNVSRTDGDEATSLLAPAVFEVITYNEPGTYVYEIVENKPAEQTPGMTYSGQTVTLTVLVERNEDGSLTVKSADYTGGTAAQDAGGQENIFTNTYVRPKGRAEIIVSKAVTGNAYDTQTKENRFTFTLTKADAPMAVMRSAMTEDGFPLIVVNNSVAEDMTQTIGADESAKWTVVYNEPGTYCYTIQETKGTEPGMAYDTTLYYVTVVAAYTGDMKQLETTVTYGTAMDGTDESLTVTNKYSEISFAPAVTKALVGENLLKETFNFVLTQTKPAAEGVPSYTDEISIEVDPENPEAPLTRAFKSLTCHEPGTYEYEIVEVKPEETEARTPGMIYSPETVVYTVVVDRDKNTGALTIASETYTTLNKVVVEEAPEDVEPGEDEATGDGAVDAGVAGNTFTNVYKRPETTAEIIVNKAMSGNGYNGRNEFTFTLTRFDPAEIEDGSDEPAEETPGEGEAGDAKVNNTISPAAAQTIGADESAVWTIWYDQPGTYIYTVQETNGGEVGMEYDETVYYVTVTVDYLVDENGDRMSMTATVSYSDKLGGDADEGIAGGAGSEGADQNAEPGKASLTITNKFSRTVFQPEVKKILKGKGAPDEIFTFELTDEYGYRDTAECEGGETAVFSTIVFYEPGEYHYSIREIEPDRKTTGMHYSDAVIKLTVNVTRAADGTLFAEAAYTDHGTIVNTYTPPEDPDPGYDYRFRFTKKWQGAVEASMEWTLYDSNGNVVHKKFNKDIVSSTEWRYEAWFSEADDYYIIEDVPEGYSPIYVNVGEFAGVTDRLHNGGTIINYHVPPTGDHNSPLTWLTVLLCSVSALTVLLLRRKRLQ